MTTPADDIDRIMAIMQTAFDPAFGEAWSRRQVEDALLIGSCHYLLTDVAQSPSDEHPATVGFCLSRHGFGEEELLLFAVAPEYRGKGLGRRMLARFAADASARGAQRLLLEMRQGNPAESLYRHFGFAAVGKRRDYYRAPDGSRLDAITFAFDYQPQGEQR